MLPDMDVTTNAATTSSAAAPAAPVRRPDNEKAMETYRAVQESEAAAVAEKRRSREDEAAAAARDRAATESAAKDRAEKRADERRDSVEINLHVSAEERDALARAIAGGDEAAEMTPEEKETAKKAAERLSAYVEEAVARNRESRERVEKAVGEWYSRLSRGEPRGETDLLRLFRDVAMGRLDD